MGVCRAKVAEHVRLGADHARIGRAVELPEFRLDFHKLKLEFLKEVSHESFVFISSTFTFGAKSRKLHFYIFNFQFLREVSHESFVFTS